VYSSDDAEAKSNRTDSEKPSDELNQLKQCIDEGEAVLRWWRSGWWRSGLCGLDDLL
jgi:hypothetical protein